ncbi:MAG TPA: hypothetical protein VGD60_09990 [Candidatus Acidoferrales bacterium]
MSAFTANPEFLRNARIQLRSGRVIAVAVICLAVSITAWFTFTSHAVPLTRIEDASELLRLILQLQVTVLLIGGGIYELLTVHREKELNTFDYQRVTRLSSFELAIGKLFGAPVLAYLVTFCLVPVGLAAAIRAEFPLGLLLQAYVIILAGSIVFHLLALLISMSLARGVSAVAVLPYLAFVACTSIDYAHTSRVMPETAWTLHILSPYAAGEMFWRGVTQGPVDLFFGASVPHFAVLLMIYATCGGWFLLAIIRNLKRDPAVYQLYSPLQAFGFAIYFTVLMLGFFNWKAPLGQPIFDNSYPAQLRLLGFKTLPPQEVLGMVLANIFWIFAFLGLVLFRNREQVRRRVKNLGARAANLWAAFWPAPYSLAGIVVAGLVVVQLIRVYREPAPGQWSWGLAFLYIGFVALWVARDLLYLQWMGLRRGRHPLAFGALFLIVFYTCAGTILGVLQVSRRPELAPFAAALIPTSLYWLQLPDLAVRYRSWIAALGILALEALLFAFLQRAKLREFLAPAAK